MSVAKAWGSYGTLNLMHWQGHWVQMYCLWACEHGVLLSSANLLGCGRSATPSAKSHTLQDQYQCTCRPENYQKPLTWQSSSAAPWGGIVLLTS